VVREGKNFKGRVLAIVLGTIGKRALGKEPGKTVKAIETPNDSGAASRTACGGLLSRTGAGGLIHHAPYRASVHTEGSES